MTGEHFACPFCDYTAGKRGSVKAHITRKTDESHKGESGPKCAEQIETVSIDSEPDNTDPVTDSDNSQPRAATDGGPTTPEFPESPDADTEPATPDTDTVECPGCGSSDVQDASLALDENRAGLSREHIALLERSDHICTNCSGVFDGE